MIKLKNVLRLATMLVAFGLVSIGVKAQNSGPRLGIGVNIGSTLKDPTTIVAGPDVRLQQSFGNSVSVILTTGYYHFFKKKFDGFDVYNSGIIPLKAGLKIFPVKHFYVAGEAGAGFGTKDGLGTSFIYSPSAGLAFGSGFDISVKYEAYAHKDYDGYYNQLALRLAHGFKL